MTRKIQPKDLRVSIERGRAEIIKRNYEVSQLNGLEKLKFNEGTIIRQIKSCEYDISNLGKNEMILNKIKCLKEQLLDVQEKIKDFKNEGVIKW